MKTTSTGYRITRNGSILMTIEKEALQSSVNLGSVTKHEGTYYYFNRKQGNIFVYLP